MFEQLDNCRNFPLIWVTGPAGCGKTTLVNSYLKERKIRSLWYQLNESDSDPATFFYYMRHAAKIIAPKRRRCLPLLTPEYQTGLTHFTMRYFEQLYERLPHHSVIVFDNYQEVPDSSVFHMVIRQGITEIPPDIRVIIISRTAPVPELVRLEANRQMTTIGWKDLRLTPEETAGLAELLVPGHMSKEKIDFFHYLSDGWAAGVVLMALKVHTEGMEPHDISRQAPEVVFDYFASEVFERMDPSSQEFLMKTAYLPSMTIVLAEELSGNPESGRILSELARHNYFVERRYTQNAVYSYHPLFRNYLQTRARAALSVEELNKVIIDAAVILERDGQVDEALELIREAGDWGTMTMFIMQHAKVMLEQGRHKSLEQWLTSIPEDILHANPWLLYWKGMAYLPSSPGASRPLLEHSFEVFHAHGNNIGSILAASSTVNAIAFGFEDFTPLDHWSVVINDLVKEIKVFPNEEIEAWVTSSIMTAIALRETSDQEAAGWCNRVLMLKDTPETIVPKTHALYHLYWYYAMKCGLKEVEQALSELQRLSRSRNVHPFALVTTHLVEAMYYEETGMHAECLEAVTRCLDVSRQTGVHILDPSALIQAISSYINRNDWEGAREWIGQITPLIESSPPFMKTAFHLFQARMSHVRGDIDEASVHAEMAFKIGSSIGSPYVAGLCHLVKAQVLHKQGRDQEAFEYLDQVYKVAESYGNQRLKLYAHKYETHLHFDRGDEAQALQALGKWLFMGRKLGYKCFLDDPVVTVWLCQKALEAGIEVEYAQDIIRNRGFTPEKPPVHLENWPWPVKIYTLGRFSILIDDVALTFSRKGQNKPLEVLKVLIAGGGSNVADTYVADTLWPDAEGDLAMQALATNLHRLRKLLVHHNAVLLQNGMLALDKSLCWIDARAFEYYLNKADSLWEKASTTGGHDEACGQICSAIDLYRGEFLPDEQWLPDVIPMREYLHGKFLKSLSRMGEHLVKTGQYDRARQAIECGLDIDTCAEDLYRLLMVCMHCQGLKAEALSVFERCKRTLHVELGTTPSADTEALARSLRAEKSH